MTNIVGFAARVLELEKSACEEKLASIKRYRPLANWILVKKGEAQEVSGSSISHATFRPAQGVSKINAFTHDRAEKYAARHPGSHVVWFDDYLTDQIDNLRRAVANLKPLDS